MVFSHETALGDLTHETICEQMQPAEACTELGANVAPEESSGIGIYALVCVLGVAFMCLLFALSLSAR